MTLEFFMVLVAVVFGLLLLGWLFCEIDDFVDAWKRKERLKREMADHKAMAMRAAEVGLPPSIFKNWHRAMIHTPPPGVLKIHMFDKE